MDDFYKQIHTWIEDKALPATTDARQKIALEIFSRVVRKTPVDTGRARGAWVVSTGRSSDEIPQRVDRNGTVTIATGAANMERAKGDEPIFISNNLVYINGLEYGKSRQAPNGMVRTTIAEFDDIVKGET